MATTPSYAHAPGRWWEKWAKHSFASTADGIKIHYVDVGPRDALPVVLVHGWPDMWFGWRHQIQALSPTYRLIVPGTNVITIVVSMSWCCSIVMCVDGELMDVCVHGYLVRHARLRPELGAKEPGGVRRQERHGRLRSSARYVEYN